MRIFIVCNSLGAGGAERVDDWHCKGFDVLMQAWNLVARRHPEWKLMLAGQGSEDTLGFLKSFLKDDVAKKNTVFLGYSKDMLSLYGKASIYVLSSRSEGLPMVLIEAITDEAYRYEVQENAIERSKFYSQAHIVRMWEEVMEMVVGK